MVLGGTQASTMNKLGQWLQIAANLGILAGLILVAVQIDQASNLLQLQLLYEDEGREIENESTLLGDDPARVIQKSIDEPYGLTFGEMRVMESYLYRPISQIERRYKARALLGDSWKEDIEDTIWNLGTPFGRAWWDAVRSTTNPEVREVIDEALRSRDPNAQQQHFDSVRQNIAKYLEE